MGLRMLLDLENHFSFYRAYHSNKINRWIHVVCVWPILFTSLVLLAYTKPLVPADSLPVLQPPFFSFFFRFLQRFMVLNYSFVIATIYAMFYVSLDPRTGGCLAAFLVLACWVAANAVAQNLRICCGRKLFVLVQLICWSSQILGHAVFE